MSPQPTDTQPAAFEEMRAYAFTFETMRPQFGPGDAITALVSLLQSVARESAARERARCVKTCRKRAEAWRAGCSGLSSGIAAGRYMMATEADACADAILALPVEGT